MLQVTELCSEDEPDYERFVAGCPGAMIYASLPFRDFLARVTGGNPGYRLARRGGRIAGVLPAFTSRNDELGTVVNSLPWYGSHGGCLVDDPDPASVRDALLGAYQEALSQVDLLSATMILSPTESLALEAYERRLGKVALDSRIGQTTPLPAASEDVEEAILATCHPKTRNLVRKSLKQGFEEVCSDDDGAWRFLHETHVENMEAVSGRPKPWSHFQALRECLPASWRRLSLATLDGEPVAGLLLLRFQGVVEYLTPVIRVQHRSRQPLSFLIHRGMAASVRSGHTLWNWGGTWLGQRSLHHFKAGWGAQDRPYSYLVTAGEEAVARMRERRADLTEAFPYFYVYPYDRLSD